MQKTISMLPQRLAPKRKATQKENPMKKIRKRRNPPKRSRKKNRLTYSKLDLMERHDLQVPHQEPMTGILQKKKLMTRSTMINS